MKRSAPARLYVLQAVAREPAAATGDAPRGVLGVQRVSVPAWMDRPEITARTGKGEIVPDPLARWGEPITRGIQRVVTENLAALLPERHLVAAPFAASQAVDHRLDLAITEGARQADDTRPPRGAMGDPRPRRRACSCSAGRPIGRARSRPRRAPSAPPARRWPC